MMALDYNVIESISENIWTSTYKLLLKYREIMTDGDRTLIANEIGYLVERELGKIDETREDIVAEEGVGREELSRERNSEAREEWRKESRYKG